MGIEYFRCGQYQKASQAMKKALQASPDNTIAKQYLSDLQEIHSALNKAVQDYDSGNYQDCLQAIKQVQRKNPHDPSANSMAHKVSNMMRHRSTETTNEIGTEDAKFSAPNVPLAETKSKKKVGHSTTAWTVVLCLFLLLLCAGVVANGHFAGTTDGVKQRPQAKAATVDEPLDQVSNQASQDQDPPGQQAIALAQRGNHAGALLVLEELRRDANVQAIAHLADSGNTSQADYRRAAD